MSDLPSDHVTVTTTPELEPTVPFPLLSDYQAQAGVSKVSRSMQLLAKVKSLHSLPMLCMQEDMQTHRLFS